MARCAVPGSRAERRRPWSRARSPASAPRPPPPPQGRGPRGPRGAERERERERGEREERGRTGRTISLALEILASSFSQRSSCSASRAAPAMATKTSSLSLPLLPFFLSLFFPWKLHPRLPVEEGQVVSKMIGLPRTTPRDEQERRDDGGGRRAASISAKALRVESLRERTPPPLHPTPPVPSPNRKKKVPPPPASEWRSSSQQASIRRKTAGGEGEGLLARARLEMVFRRSLLLRSDPKQKRGSRERPSPRLSSARRPAVFHQQTAAAKPRKSASARLFFELGLRGSQPRHSTGGVATPRGRARAPAAGTRGPAPPASWPRPRALAAEWI